MSIMFASSQGQPAAGSGHLVEFKAGRTMIEPGSTPEKRNAVANPDPGLVYVKHSQDDSLLHFCWQNRKNNQNELDLIIFPGETEFKRIVECKDGRVYMLKFKNSEERHLFWLQEPKDDKKDEEICKKVNELLSNAPPTRPAGRAGAAPAGDRSSQMERFAAAFGGNMEDIGPLGNMDQNQLMRLFSLMNGGAAGGMQPADLINLGQMAAATKTSGAQGSGTKPQQGSGQQLDTGKKLEGSSGGITPQLLNQIIKAASSGSAGGSQKQPAIDLSTVLTRAKTQETVEKHKDQLKPHLPDQSPVQDANAELAQTVGNPQFQQAADFFGNTLQLGQIGAALEQFGLDNQVVEAAKKGDLQQFAEKLSEQEKPKDANEAEKALKKEAEDEECSTTAAAAREDKQQDKGAKKELKSPQKKPDDDDEMGLD